MNGFELNKIAAAILLASFITLVASNIADILYKPKTKIVRGYQIEVKDNVAKEESTVVEVALDIPEIMKNANAEAGKEIVKKCMTCHSLDKDGPNRIGPHLWNVVNADKARIKDYNYSSSIQAKGGIWSEEELFHFLQKPSKFLPGTKMTFVGFINPKDIANVIAYLKTYVHDQ